MRRRTGLSFCRHFSSGYGRKMNRNGRATGNAGNLMGILLIVAGVVIAGNVMNWWNISSPDSSPPTS